ncbi:M50 family metallopeptidase [Allobranchiibius sp. GilTou38]|uniref:M50 family metallopeptidase n=1 Tax=Allobranchiibius sp. GilTou38 TaxID=2815210 RepID=UPI001AA1AAA4|nr:M50 family metallopeptidase [Allobranchiibius sp. GilTou38]MBO1766900.1 M50 family metallopeptidase [Allobranchiibius sp. GilTou38]
MSSATDLWHRVTAAAPPPSREVVIGTMLLALVIVCWAPVWRVARSGITLAHEGSHAIAALSVGRSLHGVHVHRDTSGVTVSRGPARGSGAIATFAAGYPGPAVLGALGAWVLSRGYAAGVLWAVLLVLAAMTLQIRNWYGALVMLVCALPVAAITWWCTAPVQSGFAHLLMWFLLLGSPRTVLDLARNRRYESGRSDADQLAALTRVPAVLWIAAFALISLAVTVLGGALLLGRVG